MNAVLVCSAALLLMAPGRAQVTYTTAPPGYDSKAGGYYGSWLFTTLRGRMQLVDGGGVFRAMAATFDRVDYRSQTYKTYRAANGAGRTFTSLRLDVAMTDAGKLSTTYSRNYGSQPTRVYKGKLTLPTLSGWPKPVWGNVASLPFASPWKKSKGTDVVLDFQFSGGVIANGATPSTNIAGYDLDAIKPLPNVAADWGVKLPSLVTCNDGYFKHTFGASLAVGVQVYSPRHLVPMYRGKLELVNESNNTAPGAAIIHVATLGGSDTGVVVAGFGCSEHRLYVDLGKILGQEVYVAQTSSNGEPGRVYRERLLDYHGPWAGTKLYAQAAWTDSVSGQPKLTQARRLIVPAMPPMPAFEKAAVYDYVRRDGQRLGPYYALDVATPVPRFRAK